MVSKAKKRLAPADGDLGSSPSRLTNQPNSPNQRKQPKRRALQSQLPPSPQVLDENEEQQKQSNRSSPSKMPIILPENQQAEHAEEQEDPDQQAETQLDIQEREARERTFDEFKQEYFDIIDQVPLDLNRKFGCITELEQSLEECKRELHEDLIAYTNFAKEIDLAKGPESTVDASEVEGQDEISTRLRTLAQPMLWGVVPIAPIDSDGLPDHLKTLLTEISAKITRLQELSHDKLNLAESVYLSLDRQLKRLDADLETYQDLEDQDAQDERHNRETETAARTPPLESCPEACTPESGDDP